MAIDWSGWGLGIGTSLASEGANQIFGELNQRRQLRGQKKALEQQNAAALDLWNKTNYSAQMGHLKEAGLNPGLIYGMGGAGGQLGGSSAMPGSDTGDISPMGIAQIALLDAQRRNIEADTANKLNENPKGIEEVEALKISNEIQAIERDIRKATSLEEYGARANELEARKWAADNIVRLGENGKLMLRSLEELEGIMLQNAKSRADRKKVEAEIDMLEKAIEGKDLENRILKLEEELQRKTGLDRNSPYYLKAIGRLLLKIL